MFLTSKKLINFHLRLIIKKSKQRLNKIAYLQYLNPTMIQSTVFLIIYKYFRTLIQIRFLILLSHKYLKYLLGFLIIKISFSNETVKEIVIFI